MEIVFHPRTDKVTNEFLSDDRSNKREKKILLRYE